MTEKELFSLLELHNLYTFDNFTLRLQQCENLDALERSLVKKLDNVMSEHQQVQ